MALRARALEAGPSHGTQSLRFGGFRGPGQMAQQDGKGKQNPDTSRDLLL